jgi:hypothetical protein
MWLSVPAALAGLAVELMLGQFGIVSADSPKGTEGEAGGDGGDQGDGDHFSIATDSAGISESAG